MSSIFAATARLLPILGMLALGGAVSQNDVVTLPGDVALELVRIAPGSFARQTPGGEPRRVAITRPFYLSRYEVTWRQWSAVLGTRRSADQPDHPARGMSWHEIQAFIEALNEVPHSGKVFRLPTEAEWEYAARAGTTSRWSSGDDPADLLQHAWIRANARGVVQPVGTRLPNPWGLFDMHGNVWEWVADWHDPEYFSDAPQADPAGPATGTEKVRRGGSVMYSPGSAASSHRYQQPPDSGNDNLGFRLAADLHTVRTGTRARR